MEFHDQANVQEHKYRETPQGKRGKPVASNSRNQSQPGSQELADSASDTPAPEDPYFTMRTGLAWVLHEFARRHLAMQVLVVVRGHRR